MIEQSTSVKTPIYKILVDGVSLPIGGTTSVVSGDQCRRDLTYKLDTVNKIEIHFTNKEHTDTRVKDDKIVEDLLIIIDKFLIDGIDVASDLSRISFYKDIDGAVHRTGNYITFNGCMTIKIHKNILYHKWLVNHC
jgi:hypothetical protein